MVFLKTNEKFCLEIDSITTSQMRGLITQSDTDFEIRWLLFSEISLWSCQITQWLKNLGSFWMNFLELFSDAVYVSCMYAYILTYVYVCIYAMHRYIHSAAIYICIYIYIWTLKERKVKNDFSDRVIKVWVNFILPDKFTSAIASWQQNCHPAALFHNLKPGPLSVCMSAETVKSTHKCNSKFASECIVLKS